MEEVAIGRVLIKNTGLQMLAHVVSIATSMLTAMVLSRFLGVTEFGQFSYVFAFFYFFLTLSDIGVGTIVVRQLSQRKGEAGQIIGTMVYFKVLLAIVFVVVAWLTIWLMRFPDSLAQALFLYALVLPVIALELPAVIFQVLLKLEYPAGIGMVHRILTFCLLAILAWAGTGLVVLIAALVLAEIAWYGALVGTARRFVRPVWRLDRRICMEVLWSSIPLGMTNIMVAVINRADFLMLERLTDLREVGLYSACYKVTNLLEAFPLMVMATIYPLFSRYAAEDMDKLRSLFRKSTLGLSLSGLCAGVGITLAAPIVIRILFGAEFGDAATGLRVLVWSSVFVYATLTSSNLLICMGRERWLLLLYAGAAGMNIVLNLLLIPRYGFVGAAFSTSVTYLFVLIGVSIGCQRVLRPEGGLVHFQLKRYST